MRLHHNLNHHWRFSRLVRIQLGSVVGDSSEYSGVRHYRMLWLKSYTELPLGLLESRGKQAGELTNMANAGARPQYPAGH